MVKREQWYEDMVAEYWILRRYFRVIRQGWTCHLPGTCNLDNAHSGEGGDQSPSGGYVVMGAIAANLVGLIYGVCGLVKKNQKKLLPVIGLRDEVEERSRE